MFLTEQKRISPFGRNIIMKKRRARKKVYTIVKTFKISPEQEKQLKSILEHYEIDLSEYIRSRLFKKKIEFPKPKVEKAAEIQLRRIGNNLNQITKVLHSTKGISDIVAFDSLLKELMSEIKEIKKKF